MNKKLLYVLLAINSVNLWASDQDAVAKKTVQDKKTLEKITPNKRSYTDLAAQVALSQTVKHPKSSEQTKELDHQAVDLQKTDRETVANEWDRRTALQQYFMTPNEHDRLHNWPQDHAPLEKPLSPGRALSSDESDYKPGSPAYLDPYSSCDDEDQHCQRYGRSQACTTKDRAFAHTSSTASAKLLRGVVSSMRCIEPKNSFTEQQGQWCEYHDRSETCGACATPTYSWGYGRNGNDSE